MSYVQPTRRFSPWLGWPVVIALHALVAFWFGAATRSPVVAPHDEAAIEVALVAPATVAPPASVRPAAQVPQLPTPRATVPAAPSRATSGPSEAPAATSHTENPPAESAMASPTPAAVAAGDPAGAQPSEALRMQGPVRTAPVAEASACQKPSYPLASLRALEEGTVGLEFLVAADGRVEESRVVRSSGFRRLDEAARRALALCRFRPATEDGQAVPGWARIDYQWRIDG